MGVIRIIEAIRIIGANRTNWIIQSKVVIRIYGTILIIEAVRISGATRIAGVIRIIGD
jgi:hypothetical protein